MLIYRVAKLSHGGEEIPLGPYRRNYDDDDVIELSQAICEAHSWNDEHHPPPCSDRLGDIDAQEYCGFTSMHDLNQWFKGWLNDLHATGFELYVYDVPELLVRAGRCQVVAGLTPEMLIETRPLVENEMMEAA